MGQTKGKYFMDAGLILDKMIYLDSIYPTKRKLAMDLECDKSLPGIIIRGTQKSVTKLNYNSIEKLYSIAMKHNGDIKAIRAEARGTTMRDTTKPKKAEPKKLFKGKHYKCGGFGLVSVKGTIVKEYERFYLVQGENYTSTVLKNDLYLQNFKAVQM